MKRRLPLLFALSVVWPFLASCTYLSELFVSPCPDDMVYVHNQKETVRFCVDRFEYSAVSESQEESLPSAGLNYYQCHRFCRGKGKRMLRHSEWVLACQGTRPETCNKFRDHPVLRRASQRPVWYYQGKDCRKARNMWGDCMKDLRLNNMRNTLARNGQFEKCKSKFGARHMIGNLGEWVQDIRYDRRGRKMGRFNGGLYPQQKSSCTYTTIAHKPDYRDYSIGCRCARSLPFDQGWDRY